MKFLSNFLKINLAVLIGLLLLPSLSSAYYDLGKPTGYVDDYTSTLTADQKAALETKLDQFDKDTSNQISVVIIPSLKGDTIENFAVKLFEAWGIGQKDKDNGVLVLVAMADHQMRIEVGYGLEGALTDAQSSWIINQQMKPAFRAGDYYGGLDAAVDTIMSATKGEYVPSETSTVDVSASSKTSLQDFLDSFGSFGFFFVIIILQILGTILARSKSWWAGGVVGAVGGVVVGLIFGFLFYGLAAIAILTLLGLGFDYLVSTNYQKYKKSGRKMPWFIGGGGFGGSGGGGGFGGFGGGGSGGGGASGGW